MTDKEIDDFLIKINSTKDKTLLFEKTDDLSNIKDNVKFYKYTTEARVYEYLSEEIELIRITSGSYDSYIVYGFTKKGRDVIRAGGWLNYIENEKKGIKRKEDKESLELQITKAHAKYPYLPYWLAFGGVFVSFLAFINSCNSENKTSQDKQQKVVYIVKDTLYENYPLKDTILK